MLSLEERNDLRKRVLMGEELSLDEARAVFETLRAGSASAAIAGEMAKPKRKSSSSKPVMSDADLDKELEGFGL